MSVSSARPRPTRCNMSMDSIDVFASARSQEIGSCPAAEQLHRRALLVCRRKDHPLSNGNRYQTPDFFSCRCFVFGITALLALIPAPPGLHSDVYCLVAVQKRRLCCETIIPSFQDELRSSAEVSAGDPAGQCFPSPGPLIPFSKLRSRSSSWSSSDAGRVILVFWP